ncbi:hypothetical protein H7B90_18670 [Cohnella xylanilytica]|uniref:HPP family protein n=1 Tax=Cohnella xylanilytica TaxID=557555 RepID=A0A841TXY1_9BACL|nr:hypothetical protein [Cohnella xylanilytica]MBB6693417.1 hypothetical protein [Cohnella xylanilytica]
MKLRAVAACLYIGLVYFVSAHLEGFHPLFFPTLGAFAYLFVTRSASAREQGVIAFGALIGSVTGSILSQLHPSTLFFVVNALFTFWMIRRWKWNAPPIMAVSFVPFFMRPSELWTLPLFTAMAIGGLVLTLAAASAVERWKPVRSMLSAVPFVGRKAEAE